MRVPRASGRGNGTPRHERAKAKGPRPRSVRSSMLEENHVAAAEEVVEKTLKRLRTLGSQRFGTSPYSQHFDRWLMNLKEVLSEFESSPNLSTDDQFVKERSQILTNVELKLKERHREEASLEESIKRLSNSKNLLERIKEEYATSARIIEGPKKKVKPRVCIAILIVSEENWMR
jgi:DNA repair ATPase RecN